MQSHEEGLWEVGAGSGCRMWLNLTKELPGCECYLGGGLSGPPHSKPLLLETSEPRLDSQLSWTLRGK